MQKLPDRRGHFGPFGGRYVSETLMPALLELEEAWLKFRKDKTFKAELDALLAEYVGAISENAPLTIAAAKAITREILKGSPDQDLALCRQLIRGCFESADYAEGRTAFMQKRKPVFTGR